MTYISAMVWSGIETRRDEMSKPKTVYQLLRRKRVYTEFGKAPQGFRRHNFLLVTGNMTTNVWVATKPSDHKDGTVREYSF